MDDQGHFEVGDWVVPLDSCVVDNFGHSLTKGQFYQIIKSYPDTGTIYMTNYEKATPARPSNRWAFYSHRFELVDLKKVPELVKVIYGMTDKVV